MLNHETHETHTQKAFSIQTTFLTTNERTREMESAEATESAREKRTTGGDQSSVAMCFLWVI